MLLFAQKKHITILMRPNLCFIYAVGWGRILDPLSTAVAVSFDSFSRIRMCVRPIEARISSAMVESMVNEQLAPRPEFAAEGV